MDICGEIVKHKVFGRGKIVEFTDNHVTVLFDMGKLQKKFTYPSVFGAFLEVENKLFLSQIEEDKNTIAKKEAENKKINEELARLAITAKLKSKSARYSKKSTAKTSDKNNIAFKCNYCNGEETSETVGYESQMLEIWNAGAGINKNDDKKGKPISLKNVKANSLALLTTKLPYANDMERFIFAVFLVNENFEGDNNEEGYVGANPKYRIQLSLDEARKLKFWNYYFNPNKPEKMVFGSGLHRYFTDVQSAHVLKKICEIKKGTSEEEISKEFLEYYCRIKDLDIDKIPIPNGALQNARIGN